MSGASRNRLFEDPTTPCPEVAQGKPLLILLKVRPLIPAQETRLRGWLAAEEIARSERFGFERDKQTFLVARAALRRLLAQSSGVAPESVAFSYSEFGKPFVSMFPDLHFNVAHADGVIAIALSREGRVGVDVEPASAERAATGELRQYFAPGECSELEGCPPAERHELFFKLWTLKEALLKGKDLGTSAVLNEFAFRFGPEPDTIAFRSKSGEGAGDWRFFSGRAYGDYRWSMALECPGAAAREIDRIEYA